MSRRHSGCESIEKLSDSEHQVTPTDAVGPVKAKFKGRMHLEDPDPPSSYRMRFEGQGGVAGFARGDAAVTLKPDGAASLMSCTPPLRYISRFTERRIRALDEG